MQPEMPELRRCRQFGWLRCTVSEKPVHVSKRRNVVVPLVVELVTIGLEKRLV